MSVVEFGDYLFIEESPQVVSLAELFKTLPVKYEYLRKHYRIEGRASKQSILIGANMDPYLTIVLVKKLKTTLAAGVTSSEVSSLR